MVGALGSPAAALRAGCGLRVVQYASRCGVCWLRPQAPADQPSGLQQLRAGAVKARCRYNQPLSALRRGGHAAGARACASHSSGNGSDGGGATNDVFVLTTPLYYVNAGAAAACVLRMPRADDSSHDVVTTDELLHLRSASPGRSVFNHVRRHCGTISGALLRGHAVVATAVVTGTYLSTLCFAVKKNSTSICGKATERQMPFTIPSTCSLQHLST